MNSTGNIFVRDHNGESVGIGQAFGVLPADGGYAAFLVVDDGYVQFTDAWETEDECLQFLKTGGTGTVIVIDDLKG